MPDEQAAPDDTAIPSRSKAMTAVSAFMPATANSVVFGSRSRRRAPKITACGEIARRPASKQVAQRQHVRGLGRRLRDGRRGGGPECGNAGDVLGAGAHAALLAAAANERIGEVNVLARAAPARRRPSGRRSCAPRASTDRRRARRYRRACARPPARHRHEASRRPHARSRPPPRPAAPRRSRCWRASATPAAAAICATASRQRREVDAPVGVDRESLRSLRAETGRRRAPRHARSPTSAADRAAAFSRAVSIAGVSASMLASVPLEVKNTSRRPRPDQRRDLFARMLDQPPRGASLGMDRGRIAGDRQRRRASAARASARNGAVAFQSK